MNAKALVQAARPGHWVKNGIVLMPVIFARLVGHWSTWTAALLAAAAFCLASSAAYVLNDIRDRRRDERHPRKRNRPLVTGQLSVAAAAVEAAVLCAASLLVASLVNVQVLLVIAGYLVLQTLYTLDLKQRALVDVICVATGFVLRAVAGAVAINVEISPWLFVCTFTLCLFMGFCKRFNEIATMADERQAVSHRPVLGAYTPELLTHLITLSAGVAVVAFLLYASSQRTVANFQTNLLVYTLPAVIYGVFRFAMLSMSGAYSDPTELVLHDRPFQLVVLIWMLVAVLVVFWGRHLEQWLGGLT